EVEPQLTAEDRADQDAGFGCAACTQFHQGELVAGGAGDVTGEFFKNGALRARGIVFPRSRDLFKQAGAFRVVKELGRKALGLGAQALKYIGGNRADEQFGFSKYRHRPARFPKIATPPPPGTS